MNLQKILHKKYATAFKKDGWQAIGKVEIGENELIELLTSQGMGFESAQSEASRIIKESEAQVFLEEHPLAPKGWRKWMSKKGKEF